LNSAVISKISAQRRGSRLLLVCAGINAWQSRALELRPTFRLVNADINVWLVAWFKLQNKIRMTS